MPSDHWTTPPMSESPKTPRERELDRRRFLARSSLALSLPLFGGLSRDFGPRPKVRAANAKAQSVIHIFLQGGLSHLDSFDPKPFAPVEVRGEFGSIPTKIPGEHFSEPLALLAERANELAVLRGMHHGDAAHERAVNCMLTGYPPSPALAYPSLGAVVSHELGGRNDLPAYVAIPGATDDAFGTGYLSARVGPFSVGGEPNNGSFAVRDLNPQRNIDAARRERRRHLLQQIDSGFQVGDGADAVAAADAFANQAFAMVESQTARSAFDIKAEPDAVRTRYGRTNLGQRILLARRLAEAGVRYVNVLDSGYDHHQDIFRTLRSRLEALDKGVSALIDDMKERGILQSTLVIISTEFGRTPGLNRDRGRDHWSKAFTTVLAGGGIKGGAFFGRTTENGGEPDEDGVKPADLAATVFTQLGIDPTKRLMSPGDRPIDLVREGRVLQEILA